MGITISIKMEIFTVILLEIVIISAQTISIIELLIIKITIIIITTTTTTITTAVVMMTITSCMRTCITRTIQVSSSIIRMSIVYLVLRRT